MTHTEPNPGRPSLPRLGVDLDAIRARCWAITATRTGEDFRHALLASVLDVFPLVSEVDALRVRLVATRRRYADLLAAARASLAAARDGEYDPLYYVRDEIAAQHRDRT